MRKTGEAYIDLSLRAVDAIIPDDAQNLARDGNGGEPLRRRIIAVSEGVHNGDRFPAEEIRAMVNNAVALKDAEGRTYFAAPLILDHSWRFLDKIGATFALSFEEEVSVGSLVVRNAAVADVEFWQDTPIQTEAAARVLRDPENTYFSVRIRGILSYDTRNDEYVWSNLMLIHIAVVNEPADGNARVVGELSEEKADSADLSLYAKSRNETAMGNEDLQKRLEKVEQENADLKKRLDTKDADLAATRQAAEQVDLMERSMLIADIFQLDPEVSRDFLKDLSKPQLEAYKSDLERRVKKETTEKGRAGSNTDLSTEDLAKRLLGE